MFLETVNLYAKNTSQNHNSNAIFSNRWKFSYTIVYLNTARDQKLIQLRKQQI